MNSAQSASPSEEVGAEPAVSRATNARTHHRSSFAAGLSVRGTRRSVPGDAVEAGRRSAALSAQDSTSARGITVHLSDEGIGVREALLPAQAADELDAQPLPIQIAVVVE